jgi:DNA-directed RNA polymerase subunit RPC12/RpoP
MHFQTGRWFLDPQEISGDSPVSRCVQTVEKGEKPVSTNLKTVIVYPSVVTQVICPDCGAKGHVKRQKLLQEDCTVSCPRCKERFLIKINRRAHYRKNTSIPVHYSPYNIQQPDDQRALQGTIVDISQQGMCVEDSKLDFSPDYHKEGAIFTFLFSLPPRNELLRIQGQVAWIEEDSGGTFILGVKFSNLNDYANKQIGFFLMP